MRFHPRTVARLASLLAWVAVAWVPRALAAPDLPVVAVLAFRLQESARSLGEPLREQLADALRARLEASQAVDVVDAARMGALAQASAALPAGDAELRQAAGRLGAHWIVAGSLSALAGRYSLEVRLVPRDPKGAPASLVLTADGREALLDRLDQLAARVIERVRAPGAAPAAGAKAQAGGEAAQGPAAPPSEEAKPAPTPAPTGAAGAPAASPAGGAGPRILEVRIEGNRRIEADAIRARIAARAGAPYRPEQIAADVREIYAMGFFRDVRVFAEEKPEGVVLTFRVKENPVVRQVTISGNESIDAEKIRDTLTLTTGSTLDRALVFENKERIRALYRAQGFYLAKVDARIESVGPDAVSIDFEVEEGKKLRLREIRFRGNKHFSDGELRAVMKTKPWRPWSYLTRFLDRSGTYSEPVFIEDLQRIERKYQDAGFVQVEVGEPEVEVERNGLRVTVEIREGKRFRVGKIGVSGDSTVDLKTLRKKLHLREGEYFSRSALTADVEGLTRYYTDRGFYFASVSPHTRVDPSRRRIDINFQVEKGSLYFIRRIDISGNTRTIDPVIRREVRMVEGELYSARAVEISQRRIRGLGYFEDVEFKPKPVEPQGLLDLQVKVTEKPTGSISFGAGFSSQDRFVLTGSLSQANLFGRGYGARVSVDTGTRSSRYFFSFTDPYLLGTEFSLRSTLFRTSVRFQDFEQRQEGGELTLGHALDEADRSRGFLTYSFTSRDIRQPTGVNAAAVIFRDLLTPSQSSSLVGLSFRRDTRNDRVLPTRGSELGASLGFAGLGGFSKFVRLEARGAWYFRPPESSWLPIPFRDRSSFMVAARFGWAYSFNSIGDFQFDFGEPAANVRKRCDETRQVCPIQEIDTDIKLPLTERYFLGGLGSFQLRGYRARSVGPRRPILYRPNLGGILGIGNSFTPVGRNPVTGACEDVPNAIVNTQGNKNGKCNDLRDKKISDFEDLDETDVIGGNKFISLSFEYRFPISQQLGLLGIAFLDMGNAFAEGENPFDVTNWRYGTGLGVLWFSPFGPLEAFWGVPLNPLSVEDSSVFEFSVGGSSF